jgi:hypothetical protein
MSDSSDFYISKDGNVYSTQEEMEAADDAYDFTNYDSDAEADFDATDPVDSSDNADIWSGATLNAYGQWIDRNGNFIQNATQDEIDAHPESEDPTLTGGGEGAEDPREPAKPPSM